MASVRRTSDGRNIGIEIIEVKSFPVFYDSEKRRLENQSQAQQFLQLIKEFRNTYNDNRAVFEILWVTRPVKGQAYNSEIKIFLILREIGMDATKIVSNLKLLSENICSSLIMQSYSLKICENIDGLKKILGAIDNECVLGLKKKEKYAISSTTQATLFYNDILEYDTCSAFDNLISRFSELKDCAISFQIFPEELGIQDKLAIGEMVSLYSNIINGKYSNDSGVKEATLEFPMQSINSYYNALQGALYGYNILVFGKKESADSLSNRISSMLKGCGGTPTFFETIDFSALKIKLFSDIYNYPWNVHIYTNKLSEAPTCINTSQRIFRKLNLLMSDKELVNFFRLPISSPEMLSLNNDEIFSVSEQINEELLRDDNIKFGKAHTISGFIELGCDKEKFAQHALIVGTPGTGKTTFSLNLLLQFYRKEVPFLAIEPTKTEYRALIEKIDELQIFTPGNNEISPFIINPFIPPKGIKVEQYVPALVSAFKAAFSMESPLDVIFLKAIRTTYIEYGWKDYSKYGDPDVQEFGLYEFVMVFKRIVQESNYGRDIKGNLESGGTFRLMNLIEQNGNIYDTVKNVPIEDLLTKPTIIELNAIQDESQKALLMALLLSSTCLYTKLIQRGDGHLKNVILIDEAHVLLGNNDEQIEKNNAKRTTIKSLQNMIAEIRSYGTSIIIADQSVKKVGRDIVANTDIKIAFRLVEAEEKEILGNSINANDRIKNKMSELKAGEAFVFLTKLKTPQLIMTPDIRDEEEIGLDVSDSDVRKKMKYWDSHKELLFPFRECSLCDVCNDGCDYFLRSDANYYANKIYTKCAKEITDKMEFARYVKGVDVLLKSAIQTYKEDLRERFVECCMIQLRRKIQLETNLRLSDDEFNTIIKLRRENANG